MLFNELITTSQMIKASRGRLQKTGHLAELVRRLPDDEREIGVSYLIGKLRQGRIGIGGAALHALIQVSPAQQASLSISDVDAAMSELADTSGKGAVARRAVRLKILFGLATQDEQDFLMRLLLGELRQGALEGIMVDAIAKAAGMASDEVRRAIMLTGDAAVVARHALTEGSAGLKQFRIQLFQPIQPMLAQTAATATDAILQLGLAALEYKIDGARVQVHKRHKEVRVYSRRLNEVTHAVPEIVEAMQALPTQTLILDGEVVAAKSDGTPQPFQTTMRRFGRRLDVDTLRNELPLQAFFFDCLHCDGADLIDLTGAERAAIMQRILPSRFIMPRIVTDQALEAEGFMSDALGRGHEGIMAKSLYALYEAGNRGSGWLKIKSAHALDLVVLAAEWGSGRRHGWLSNLHLGARDLESGGFIMLGKTFKGLTDELLAWQTEQLLTLQTTTEHHIVHVRPELVVEVVFNDVQRSSQYPGGLALRFARVKRYRPDKRADDADTIESVRAIYERQADLDAD